MPARAWDEEGHVIVTELAVRLLGDDAPEFIRNAAARARLSFLSAEPDRWRNMQLPPMGHINSPDHYIDIELLELYGLTPQTLPPFRYDYVAAMVRHKAAHPDQAYHYDPSKDNDRSKEWPGFAPYRISELYVQLKSSWRTLNTYEKYADVAGDAAIQNCREDIVYLMGILSHYVGDCAQPLHTTKHFNGWVGENPKGYTTDTKFHQHIDGGVISAAKIRAEGLFERLPTAPRAVAEQPESGVFRDVVAYCLETFAWVEPIYELEKRGAFRAESESFAEGTRFIEDRLVAGAVMLAGLWDAARRDAGIDAYREKSFQRRRGE